MKPDPLDLPKPTPEQTAQELFDELLAVIRLRNIIALSTLPMPPRTSEGSQTTDAD